ncbi:DUF3662 and FHA domain-containing protein [Rarobacter faecitabidus]|uniref:Type III secretion system (T3SS) inner membrane Yop/YscD-like protein n=1 Tax=Rarobacter faecitabidus TaxID=13243 RepID=A0A542ZP81_RARFA|nr:DUF3662 and FHA domain-containing protein [Rarobacter faecitabidus]TQL62184.1 type III secretion system (T3SS) inner membrane Yop/YscD-like protein [Rarobacter faecitabidus]
MGFLDRLENGTEKAVGRVFRKFRGELKVVELVSAIKREADERAAAIDQERTVVPNVYSFTVSPPDRERLQSWGEDAITAELGEELVRHATRQGYALVGPVRVAIVTGDLPQGQFDLTSETVRSAVQAHTSGPNRHPMVDIDGQRYLLTGTVTVIGRGSESDIVVDDPGISRRHLELSLTAHGVVARDLGSTNGLYVEGHQVPAATLMDGNTLTIGRTRISFWDAEPDDTEND